MKIDPQSAIVFDVLAGQTFRITDVEGKQVADFVCFSAQDFSEELSTKTTIDLNNSIFLYEGNSVFSNRYEPLFTLQKSPVPHHDLIFPACSTSMFQSLYSTRNHPSCRTNLTKVLEMDHIPDPVNFFMNTSVDSTGKIQVHEPLSGPGDSVVLSAEKDLRVGIAACSVEESCCNGFDCTGLEVAF